SAVEGALASGFATADLHHAMGHDRFQRTRAFVHRLSQFGSMTNLRCSSRTGTGRLTAPLSSQAVSGFSRDTGGGIPHSR
ncbi:MAG: hypothetical protein EOR84_03940, partial [Mesorhizobium sp.]